MRSSIRFSRFLTPVWCAVAVFAFSVSAFGQTPVNASAPTSSNAPAPAFSSDNVASSMDQQPIVPLISSQAPAMPPAPPPFGGPLLERTKLWGDWFGNRTALRDGGVTTDMSTTQYYQGTASGGRQDAFRYGGREDCFLNVDGEKAGFWKGLFVTLHGETRYGQSANSLTGALMPVNLSLALPQPNGSVTALTGVKLVQFLSEDMVVFGGKINTLDNFKQQITQASGLDGFMNTALMFNPIYARTVPYSTYGAGFVYMQNFDPVFSVAVLDTNNTPTTSGFNSFFSNGATILGQLNLPTMLFELPGHQGISGTYSTGKYTDLQPTPYFDPSAGLALATTKSSGSWSLAYNFDQALYVSPDNPKNVWGLFGNLGTADNNPNPVQWFANAGVSGTSPIEGRSQDKFGVGYYYLGVSNVLKDLAPLLLPLRNEQGVEFYYNAAVTPWFHVTPDIQIVDPFLSRQTTSVVVGMRAKIDF